MRSGGDRTDQGKMRKGGKDKGTSSRKTEKLGGGKIGSYRKVGLAGSGDPGHLRLEAFDVVLLAA